MKAFLFSLFFGVHALALPAYASIPEAEIQDAYAQAVAARGAGRPDLSERILRELIALRPNAVQLRFDLAVALGEQGRCASAARAFETAASLSASPSIRATADAAMADICPGLAPVDFNVDFAVVYDSNANAGAGSSSVTVGGVPVTLSDDAVATGALGYTLGANVAYNWQIAPRSYITPAVAFSLSDYEGTRFDTLVLSPSVSYRHRGDRIDWRVGPFLVKSIDDEGQASQGAGISSQADIALSPFSGLHLDASILKVQDERNRMRDYRQSNVSMVYRWASSSRRQTYRVFASLTDLDYRDDFQSLRSAKIGVGVSGVISSRVGYDVALSHRENRSKVDHYLFGARADHITSIEAKLSFPKLEGWYGRPYVGLGHTTSRSSWETKTYDRNRVLFGFTRSF